MHVYTLHNNTEYNTHTNNNNGYAAVTKILVYFAVSLPIIIWIL